MMMQTGRLSDKPAADHSACCQCGEGQRHDQIEQRGVSREFTAASWNEDSCRVGRPRGGTREAQGGVHHICRKVCVRELVAYFYFNVAKRNVSAVDQGRLLQ